MPDFNSNELSQWSTDIVLSRHVAGSNCTAEQQILLRKNLSRLSRVVMTSYQLTNSINRWNWSRITLIGRKCPIFHYHYCRAFLHKSAGWLYDVAGVRTRGRGMTRYNFDDARHRLYNFVIVPKVARICYVMTNVSAVSKKCQTDQKYDMTKRLNEYIDLLHARHGDTTSYTKKAFP